MTSLSAALAGPAIAQSVDALDRSVQVTQTALVPREVPVYPGFPPYEIHVAPSEFALYWTLPGARAIRYDVGIGQPGLYQAGRFYVGAKQAWPSWRPTPAMIAREPAHYGPLRDGLPGGPDNPLGARALYLFQPETGDTLLRIHGTNRPETIGQAVSNGCARLVNDQIIDLFDRVPVQTKVYLYAQL